LAALAMLSNNNNAKNLGIERLQGCQHCHSLWLGRTPRARSDQPFGSAHRWRVVKAPALTSEPKAKNGDNLRQGDEVTTGSIEKLVSREEQPATIKPPKGAPVPRGRAGRAYASYYRSADIEPSEASRRGGRGSCGAPPNAVTSQRARQSAAGDGTAEPNRAHLAAAPIAPAVANSAAVITPPVLGSGYAVQVTSERSESGAQAALRTLKAKYPN
jgi:hypothetical protein